MNYFYWASAGILLGEEGYVVVAEEFVAPFAIEIGIVDDASYLHLPLTLSS
jgi:hypothetical protein